MVASQVLGRATVLAPGSFRSVRVPRVFPPLVLDVFPRRFSLLIRIYMRYSLGMRRKTDVPIPFEATILEALILAASNGSPEMHGYLIARTIQEATGAKILAGHGTLYRALDRLHHAGWATRRWEDQAIAESERRPARRLYQITAEGRMALKRIPHSAIGQPVPAPRLAGA